MNSNNHTVIHKKLPFFSESYSSNSSSLSNSGIFMSFGYPPRNIILASQLSVAIGAHPIFSLEPGVVFRMKWVQLDYDGNPTTKKQSAID